MAGLVVAFDCHYLAPHSGAVVHPFDCFGQSEVGALEVPFGTYVAAGVVVVVALPVEHWADP